MAIQESVRRPLTEEIRLQKELNRIRGDRKSYYDGPWDMYGKDISDYGWSFLGILDENIKDLLKNKKNPVVIDLMSPTDAISSLFSEIPDEKKLGLAVSLEDLRKRKKKKQDAEMNIKEIAGDILESSTWDVIEKELNGRKADLIMERAVDGLDCIPRNPKLYAILLNKAWKLLSRDGGILLAEFPGIFDIQVWRMISGLRRNEDKSMMSLKDEYGACYLQLVKTPNSPEKLSFPL
jgi:hypothetical protein